MRAMAESRGDDGSIVRMDAPRRPFGVGRLLVGRLLPACGLLAASCGRAVPPPEAPVEQTGPGFYQELSWSPDGSVLLVSVLDITDDDPGYAYRIWTVDPAGGGASPLTEGPRDYWTTWSPDARRIAFAAPAGDGSLDLFAMNADGSGRTRLTTAEGDDTQPAWSPDGRRIAFVSAREDRPQLWVMSADGTGARRLLDTPGEAQNPAWSPDGARIAFYETDASGENHVVVVTADGSAPRRLTAGVWPSWTPDGSSLLFGAEGGLYRIAAAGGEPELVIAGDVIAGELSTDGGRLAYIVRDGSTISLVVSDPGGGDPRTLMRRPAPDW